MFPDDQPVPPQQPAIPPQQVYGPQMPPAPQPNQVPQQPVAGRPSPKGEASRKKLFIIVGAGVLVVLIVGILVVALAGNKSPKKPTGNSTTKQLSAGVTPASPLLLQQNVDAINQNLSGLNDNQDFPQNALSDTTLAH